MKDRDSSGTVPLVHPFPISFLVWLSLKRGRVTTLCQGNQCLFPKVGISIFVGGSVTTETWVANDSSGTVPMDPRIDLLFLFVFILKEVRETKHPTVKEKESDLYLKTTSKKTNVDHVSRC